MRVLVDVVHPAHVHFYRYVLADLRRRGHDVLVASRDKDVTLALLDRLDIDHTPISTASRGGRLHQAGELVRRDVALWRIARRFAPDVVLTRNPTGVHVARVVGATGVFDTDDGTQAGLLYRLAAPAAHVITTPMVLDEDLGPRQRPYPAYKPMAYLHPSRFEPDATVLARLPVEDGYTVIRLVEMSAVHDRGESGLSSDQVDMVVDLATTAGTVYISSEVDLPTHLARLRAPVAPDHLHTLLSGATLFIGDSQTMAAEAAILGVPTIHVSSFSGRLGALHDLHATHGLIESRPPSDWPQVLTEVGACLDGTSEMLVGFDERHAAMLAAQVDLTSWYVDLVESLE